MKHVTGFSLIELLVVLTLIALLATLVPRGLQRLYSTSQADSAAYAIAAQLQDCALLALRVQRVQVAGKERAADCRIVTASDIQVAFKDGIAPVFYPDGSSNGGHVVISSGQRRLMITTNPINARIRVHTNDES